MAKRIFTGKLQLVELEPRIAPSAVLGAISEGLLAFAAFTDGVEVEVEAYDAYADADEFDIDGELADLAALDADGGLDALLMPEFEDATAFTDFAEPIQVELADLGFDGPEVRIEMDAGVDFIDVQLAPDIQAEVIVNDEVNVDIDVETDVATEA